NSCYFTMVAKNEDGTLKQVPKLIFQNNEDIRRFWDAKNLRKMRMEITTMLNTEVKAMSFKDMLSTMEGDRYELGFDM
ncbi:MAG: hypothetical protein JNJ99_05235, partial [Crocinitomicaceae bacterium]|nr:hypothetical protein [Crocinitomicaceae bacterium]